MLLLLFSNIWKTEKITPTIISTILPTCSKIVSSISSLHIAVLLNNWKLIVSNLFLNQSKILVKKWWRANKVLFYEPLCTINYVLYDNLSTKCFKQALLALEKDKAGKKMPAGTRLSTAGLVLTFQKSENKLLRYLFIISLDQHGNTLVTSYWYICWNSTNTCRWVDFLKDWHFYLKAIIDLRMDSWPRSMSSGIFLMGSWLVLSFV